MGKIGSARAFSPAIIAQYHFGQPSWNIRPYLGAGVTYVWFNDIGLSNAMSAGQFLYSPAFATKLEGPTSASLSGSFAPIANGGVDFNLSSHWSVGLSFSYVWLSTKATLTAHSALGTVVSRTRLTVDPIVTFLSVGYRF